MTLLLALVIISVGVARVLWSQRRDEAFQAPDPAPGTGARIMVTLPADCGRIALATSSLGSGWSQLDGVDEISVRTRRRVWQPELPPVARPGWHFAIEQRNEVTVVKRRRTR